MARSDAVARAGLPTVGFAAAGDRRFRRPDVRPAGRRRLGRWCWRVARAVLGVGLLGTVAYAAAHTMLASRLFLVDRLVVRGNARLSTGEIEALVEGLRGRQVLRVDLDEYRRRLMDSPWVAGAVLRRVLPGTIEIRVVERTPMAIARVGERLYLVDQEGVIIDEFGPQYHDLDLPIVDGLVRTPGRGAPAVDSARAALTRRFLEALRGAGRLPRRLSQIDVSDDRDVVVLLDGDSTVVRLGDDRFVDRLRTYEDLAPTLQERLRDIDYVDMRFDERVYVKSKGPQPAAGSPRAPSGGL